MARLNRQWILKKRPVGDIRRSGWGTKPMEACEAEAVRRGAWLASLQSFSWQARPFYEKRGDTLFAELLYNEGDHHIYWLKKELCA